MTLAQEASPVAVALTAATGAAGSAALFLALAQRGGARATRPWGPPLALAAAGAVGHWLLRGRPSFPPAQTVQWLFYTALAGGAAGALESSRGPIARWVRALCAVLLPLFLLAFQREHHWSRLAGILWTAGLALVLFLAWNALAAREERAAGRVGATTTLGLALATALSAGSYGLGGGGVLAQQAGGLALALGLCALLGLWRGAAALGAAGVAPYVLLHHGMLWVAFWLNELSTASFVLLALVPFAALVSGRVPAQRVRLRAALALGAPTLLAAAALAVEFASADVSAYG